MVCGFGDQVSYEAIVRKLGRKSTNHRASPIGRDGPLTDKQLVYALSDVTHLRTVYETLQAQLSRPAVAIG